MNLEEFVRNSKSKPCALVIRNFDITQSRKQGLTLQQIAIKFNISKRQVIEILKK